MDVSFTEDQLALRAGLRELLAARCTTTHVRAATASETGADLELYRQLVDFGIAELPGLVEIGIAFEECGGALVPAPALSAVGICAPALAAAARDCEDDELVPAVRDGSAIPVLVTDGEAVLDGGRVRATFPLVPEAHVATHVVCAAAEGSRVSLVAVEAVDAAITVHPTMDATRRVSAVTLDGAPARVIGTPGGGLAALAAARVAGAVAVAHELVGVAAAALDMAVAHARLREQFGRPIGAYQAISHRCVDMFVALESARSLAYYAAWAVQTGAPDAALAASQAKASASEGAVFCTQSNIQVHGGIGFTWEHGAHLYLKRARSSAALLGGASEHRQQVADLLFQ